LSLLSRFIPCLYLALPFTLPALLGQAQTSINLQNYLDENSWNSSNRLQGDYVINDSWQSNFSNVYNLRYIIARQTRQESNQLRFNVNRSLAANLRLYALIESSYISNDESGQDYAQHTLLGRPAWQITPQIEISPGLGTGLSVDKGHRHGGVVFSLNSNGQVYADAAIKSDYRLLTDYSIFGLRENYRYEGSASWRQQISSLARDSLRIGFFINYNENFLQRGSDAIEALGKSSRFLENTLTYQISRTSEFSLLTFLEWKDLQRNSPSLADSRSDLNLENTLRLQWQQENWSGFWDLRFRNEQRSGANSAINTDTRLTSSRWQSNYQIHPGHTLRARLFLSKYETFTPASQNRDRDELRWLGNVGYTWQIIPQLQSRVDAEVSENHQVYLASAFSSNNNRNRIYLAKTALQAQPWPWLENTLTAAAEANYTIFDFEDSGVLLRSRLVRNWSISDSLRVQLHQRLSVHYYFFWSQLGLGNFDQGTTLFYRDQDRYTRQHQVGLNARLWSRWRLHPGIIYYTFAQRNPRGNQRSENDRRNLVPYLELSVPRSNNLLFFLLAEWHENETIFLRDASPPQRRSYLRAELRLMYSF
jgi:hypothetical protein